MHCALISRQQESRDLKNMAYQDDLQLTLMRRIIGIIHDVQQQLDANNVERETLDGLCFRAEQLARQVARLVTANIFDWSVLNCVMVTYEKINSLLTTR